MTDPADDLEPAESPSHVLVYGNDHSPWVQAVLLGLHEKHIPYTLVTVPPLSVFLDSGILMPAAKVDGGPWLLDSEKILIALGFTEVDSEARDRLQRIFGLGAMERTADPWQFWRRFSDTRDGHPAVARRLWNQFWRAFSIFYFFAVITIGRRGRKPTSRERLAQGFGYFQERLKPGQIFLGGDIPTSVDLQLFGLVQMCASIPGPSLAVLLEDPGLQRLREWAASMQHRFREYDHLHSAVEFEPKLPEIERAAAADRFFYWLGAALMWIALPVTLPMVLYFVRRVRKQGLLRT